MSGGGSMTVDLSKYTGEKAPAPFRPVSSRCKAAIVRKDVTPPVGIYNRNCTIICSRTPAATLPLLTFALPAHQQCHATGGAAAGDVATGVHMPLYTTALALAPVHDAPELVGRCAGHAETLLLVTVDLGWLLKDETNELIDAIAASSGVSHENLLLQLSHTHAGPSMTRPFVDPDCPGGALAMKWWDTLKSAAAAAAAEAVASLQPVWLSSAVGKCDLAQKRDMYDLDVQDYVTVFNPWTYGEADDTLVATRILDDSGDVLGTICNYGCHPTSMGHPTSLLSPDWPGATRVALEEEVGGVCVFVLGACGETACIQAHQGDPAVTERDGRRVGLAACSALGSLPPDGGVQLEYSGPIISGAVIGQWSPAPFSAEAVKNASAFRSKELAVSVPMRPMESAESAKANLDEAEARLAAAQEAEDTDAIAKELALAEQARRNYRKIADWQLGDGVIYKIWVWQLGDLFVVGVPGEPYSELQVMIREALPEKHVIVSVNTNGSLTQGYILPAGMCGCGCYQDKIAVLGAGGMEIIASAASAQIAQWAYGADAAARPASVYSKM